MIVGTLNLSDDENSTWCRNADKVIAKCNLAAFAAGFMVRPWWTYVERCDTGDRHRHTHRHIYREVKMQVKEQASG